jgi:hypothetical protein
MSMKQFSSKRGQPHKTMRMFKVRKPSGGYTNVPAVSMAAAKAIVAKVYAKGGK